MGLAYYVVYHFCKAEDIVYVFQRRSSTYCKVKNLQFLTHTGHADLTPIIMRGKLIDYISKGYYYLVQSYY